MIDVLTQKALDRGCADRIVAAVDNGELLQTVESSSCDVYVSNFGLVFFNSPEDGLKQAKRVLRSGGRLAISTWSEHTPAFDIITNVLKQLKERNTPVGVEGVLDTKDHTIQDCGSGSDFSKRTEHLNTVNSDASAPDRAGEGTPIANNRSSQSQSSPNQAFRRFRNAYALPALMKKYEFEEVRVHPISHQLLKPTPDAYWTRMSTASPGTIHTLGELSSSDREWVKKTTIQCLTDQFGAGPVSLEAKAYIVLANKT
ncbi:hypothetical protein SARC_11800 [Sphaeroforma arctica JP610]|uniref:Methyltransferase type 11 domain-containing protein n=1 Tax=Sphaeroforma arctica JP610 TaxID=667725 RepID=A0A0L0FGU5_9EUKA|nr:hypothetical protein SARC_11800 [Sphaeroforma arctica JP610]KNC75681.1 hypothetical protein SARC_11800 [Sphaeroforma arctica JP610]|eukprot:XP_014149583.1 hypothetical protein SARC_11800 [Sphaeroforma arctica JP610]